LVDSWNSKSIGECHNKPQRTTEIIGHKFYSDCLDTNCSFWNSLKNIPHLEFSKSQGENGEATIPHPPGNLVFLLF
jgi:hypothetical protein